MISFARTYSTSNIQYIVGSKNSCNSFQIANHLISIFTYIFNKTWNAIIKSGRSCLSGQRFKRKRQKNRQNQENRKRRREENGMSITFTNFSLTVLINFVLSKKIVLELRRSHKFPCFPFRISEQEILPCSNIEIIRVFLQSPSI